MPLAVAFAFAAGLLTILAPCTLPVVPFVLGSSSNGGRLRTLGVVVGFGSSFVVTTVVLASILAAVGFSTGELRTGSAIALGLVGAGLLVPVVGLRLEAVLAPVGRLGNRMPGRGTGLIGGLVIGGAIGLIWAPCVGPLMAAVIAVAVSRGPTLETLAIATAYVAGAAVPLVAVAAWGRRAIRRAGRPEQRLRLQRLFGALMLGAGMLVVTGADIPLENCLTRLLPAGLANLTVTVEELPAGESRTTVASPLAIPSSDAAPLPDLGPAPELAGITAWINSGPLTLAGLRGKVVLIHFWTFGCINCIHVQPYVKAWFERYASSGLVVIGVHTPELSFERDLDNVRNAVATDGVTFPVAFDPAFATWNAYHNSYWPAFYFVDRSGHIRHVQAGEGDYARAEQVLQDLLAEPG